MSFEIIFWIVVIGGGTIAVICKTCKNMDNLSAIGALLRKFNR